MVRIHHGPPFSLPSFFLHEFRQKPFNNQMVGAIVLVKEKQLVAHSAILRALFSGQAFYRPKDAFLLVFSFQTPICMSAPIRQHQRIFLKAFLMVFS
jgi:hypothetical protein